MVDLSVTAANVIKGSGASVRSGTAGEAIEAGEAVRLSAAGEVMLAQADDADTATCAGVALNDAADGQPVEYIIRGPYTAGGTVAVGTVYVVSAAAAGGIAPVADLASTNIVSVIGVGISATQIQMNRLNSGVAVPA